MGPLGADSLFDNNLIRETIDTSTNALLEHTERLQVYSKQNLANVYLLIQKSLLLFLTRCFTNKSIEQLPFVFTLVNTFLVYFERKCSQFFIWYFNLGFSMPWCFGLGTSISWFCFSTVSIFISSTYKKHNLIILV